MTYLQGLENRDYNSNELQTWINTGKRESGNMLCPNHRRSAPKLLMVTLFQTQDSRMHPLVTIALRASRDAADVLAQQSLRLDRIQVVQDIEGKDVTSIEVDADKSLRYHIQNAYPNHSIESRISGLKAGKPGEPRWLLEPAVGSTNLLHGFQAFGVAIAIEVNEQLSHAVVICPLLNEEFIATRGAGAQLNSRRLRVSPSDELSGALIGIDPIDLDPVLLADIQTTLLQAGCSPRMLGETTLDLLQVAAGRYRAGWGIPSSPAGLHAAALILQEAGGICGTETGSPAVAAGKELLFANPRIFKRLVKLRHQAGALMQYDTLGQ